MPKQTRPAEGLEERLSRRIVAEELGLRVDRFDDGLANGQVDALIRSPLGDIPLEVVGDHDDHYRAQSDALEKKGSTVRLDPASQGWYVWLRPNADLRRAKAGIPPLLPDVDQDGNPQTEAAALGLNRLGVSYLGPASTTGLLHLASEGVNSWEDPVDAVAWISRVLDRENDVAEKLARFGAPQAHAFIWATWRGPWAVNTMLRQDDDDEPTLPTSQPELPAGITHVWIASTFARRGALYWAREAGWRRTGWITRDE